MQTELTVEYCVSLHTHTTLIYSAASILEQKPRLLGTT